MAGQELEPGAYSASPKAVNMLIVSNNLSAGDSAFDPSLPIEEAKARINTSVLSYVRTMGVFGRSANIAVALPYSIGNLEGRYIGEFTQVYRSGLRDPVIRFAVNLYGTPAMKLKEFARSRQKTNVGMSLTVIAPLGQYDPAKLINVGANRWAWKPEMGLTQAYGRWTLELYAGAWLFTDNNNFYGGRTRSQDPIGSVQFHIIRTLRPRMWLAFDANYYTGGRTSVNGFPNADLQQNSRVGLTLAIPIDRRQSLKIGFSRGARTSVGADFNAFTVAYQYLWGGGIQ